MKRRILLVDDEVAVLLTLKAVLEISGFDVDTATSAREGKSKLRANRYHMVITDMRMESDAAGQEVIQAARTAPYHPAVALLTAFPVEEDDWDGAGPDKILVKATQTRVLLAAIEKLFETHSAKLAKISAQAAGSSAAKESAPKKSSAANGKIPEGRLSDAIAGQASESPSATDRPATKKPAKKLTKKSPSRR